MIIDTLANWKRYSALAELRKAFEFLEGQTEVCLGSGRVDIEGDRVFALVQAYAPKPLKQGRFETHQRYIDIQFVCKGAELFGYAPAGALEIETPHDAEKDVAFYRTPARFTPAALRAGMFAVCYPDDGHMPGCFLDSTDQVTKIVVKVRLP